MIVRPGMVAVVVGTFVTGTGEVVVLAAARTAAAVRFGRQEANLGRTVAAAVAAARTLRLMVQSAAAVAEALAVVESTRLSVDSVRSQLAFRSALTHVAIAAFR